MRNEARRLLASTVIFAAAILTAVSTGRPLDLAGVYELGGGTSDRSTVRIENGSAFGRVKEYAIFWRTPATEPNLHILPRENLDVVFRLAGNGAISAVTERRAGEAGSSCSKPGNV